MPEGMFGVETSQIAIAVLGVGAGFLCLILVLWLIRGRGGPSPFLRGGKNRQPRLQVLDAAAVDTRRRLVLVRRDDVEHLIMIGGPTDVVIESSIVDGRSPPYHTMMKTVSEPEPAAIAATETPRAPEAAGRPAGLSAPDRRVAEPATPAARPEKPVRTEAREDFTWLGSEPVEISPAPKVVEPNVPSAPVPQPARRPEASKPAEAAVAVAQTAPIPVAAEPKVVEPKAPETKAPDLQPKAESPATELPRVANPAPVIDFPAAEPRVAATAAAAPVATPFASVAAAPAAAAVIATPAPVRSETPSVATIDETPKPREPHFEIDPPQINPPRAANDAPSLDDAVDLLEAARERVFQHPHAEAAPSIAIEPAAAPPAPVERPAVAAAISPATNFAPRSPAPVAAPAKPLGSDFERILEEEMASNLAGGNAVPAVGPATSNAPSSQLPRRDPGLPRVTGATQEPALQNEIARIFGEMSVTKDDR
ncbi:hypothetical protein ACRQ1B_06970 [Rhizobium panacihumi]|uniref:hypothetical protein n=1 Tax=Rhizobium panacihumi TaxID=2008450 RepID=UPI003D7C0CE2